MLMVRTETSTYLIDKDDNTVTRLPGDWELTDKAVERRDLRRDGEPIRLISLPEEPEVGKRLPMYIDVRQDGVETYRVTTYVTAIEEL